MIRRIFPLLFLVAVFSCKPAGEQKQGQAAPAEKPAQISSFEGPAAVLLQQLRDQGDYVNSRLYPSMIKAETVYEELEGNNLIIDIRKEDQFREGHIRGAVNVPRAGLLPYFENDIVPFKYDKIILVCRGGQNTSFSTSLLRLMGYGNVYSMRWGMCGWNSDFAGYLWEEKISSDFQDRLVKELTPKPSVATQPPIESPAASGEELLRERVSALLEENASKGFIGVRALMEDPEEYYIINWERKDKYEAGHLPGAIRYKPQGTLGIPAEMGTLPVDKTIVIYCGTGMSSGFAAAYLRLFGYDARSMVYGNNSFMHRKMIEEKETLSWHPYTEDTPKEYPYVSGD